MFWPLAMRNHNPITHSKKTPYPDFRPSHAIRCPKLSLRRCSARLHSIGNRKIKRRTLDPKK
jgi:hypothetical protein